MKFNPLFIGALSTIVVVGGIGLWLINSDDSSRSDDGQNSVGHNSLGHNSSQLTPVASKDSSNTPSQTNTRKITSDEKTEQNDTFNQVQKYLALKQFQSAIRLISDDYSSLSKTELEQLKTVFISAADQLPKQQNPLRLSALLAASEIFDEAGIWQRAANTATELENWETALQAQLSLFQFQSDPQEIAQSLRAMLLSSNEVRAKFENRGDELSIKDMYERILRVASNTPRFQLELAYSHLRLEEEFEARALLEQIVYDPELGNIAQEALNRLNQSVAVVQTKIDPPKPIRTNGIVVPLEAFGTSFIVNTRIERQNTRLLLDTGASITALSRQLIDRLNLQPLNRQIRLNTANGTTIAELYRVERLQLGRLVLNDIVVADIDMGNASNFQGLLGTDALNKLRNDYDYVIDNGQKTLIFRPK